MNRKEEFEAIARVFAEYEGKHSYSLRFLIELVRNLQDTLSLIEQWEFDIAGDCVAEARELARAALNFESRK